jgi:pimeloyl-ACP methyl ester carboxylesterase
VSEIVVAGNADSLPHQKVVHPLSLVAYFYGDREFGRASRRVRFDCAIASPTDCCLVVTRVNCDQFSQNPAAVTGASRDPGVMSLMRFLQVLAQLNGNLDRMQQLGYIMTEQQKLDAVQRLHRQTPALLRSLMLLVVLVLLLGGCTAPLSVEQVSLRASYARLNRTALSSNTPSETTLTVLRRHGLLDYWRSDPAGGIAALRQAIVGRPSGWQELFALAELSYLRGREADSRPDYLSAAVYAYAFLFPDEPEARPSPFDPRFRQACDLYNLGLTGAFSPPNGGPVQLVSATYRVPFGTVELSVDQRQFRWAGRPLVSFEPSATLEVRGLQNIYSNSGLGAPLAAIADAGPPVRQGLEIAPRLRVPTNALLLFNDPRRQVAQPVIHARLEIHTIFDARDTRIDGETIPLEYNQTAARSLSMAEATPWSSEITGFLNGNLFKNAPTHLIALQPHERGHMPVILIHGTASSPFRWSDMVNDLLEDPAIRDHFEFWLFSYATGNPIPYSALLLRRSIQDAVAQLGGVKADPALGRITLIGHSQGGLLAKMLVIDPGDRLWSGISHAPLDSVKMSQASRALVREMLFPTALPEVQRVIFIATPHRGSFVAAFSLARLAARLVTIPLSITTATADILSGNSSNLFLDPRHARFGSVYGMSPNSPFIQSLARIPVVPWVHVHSIIPVRSASGPVEQGNDGVVTYRSAHLANAESELIVRGSGHSTQSNPATIAEVRRVLLEQLTASQALTAARVAALP